VADIFSKEMRSIIMSKIKSKYNKLDMAVHNWLCGMKIRHKMYPKVSGSPDIVLLNGGKPLYLFIDGCFFHKCPKHYKRPKSNVSYWVRHIEIENVERDKKRETYPYEWLQIWEHEVRDGTFKYKIMDALREKDHG
jgi:DNA mismatch endonuclease (patch repair protein)